MPNNLIKLVENLFILLAKDVPIDSQSISKFRLKPEVDVDVAKFNEDFAKKAKLITENPNSNYIINDVRVCIATHDHEQYILITGLNNQELDVNSELTGYGINPVDITLGLLLFFHNHLNLNLNSRFSIDERVEKLLSQQESPDYQGHNIEDIAPFIEDFCIFKISADSFFIDMKDVEIAYYILSNYSCKFVHLDLSSQIIDEYRQSIKDTYYAFKENIFLSLTSAHFKHSFIELYRCVEVFYGIPKALKLKESISYKKTAYELSKTCYQDLTWKNPERDSIRAIMAGIDRRIILENSELLLLVNINKDDEEPKKIEKIAEYIYQIRNQLVHQFDSAAEKNISKDNWKVLLLFLLNVIFGAYARYKDELPVGS